MDMMDDDKTLIEMSPSPAPTFRSVTKPATDVFVPISQRERHSTLWYPNGTIVLATTNMLFRVYDGILAHLSPVFKEMFKEMGKDEREAVEGVPVVELDDDAIELEHFLNTLFDRSYYCHKDRTDFAIIQSILRLSHKYQISFLRVQSINQLSTMYPSTTQNFDLIGPDTLLVKNEDDVELIHVARETNALQLLPIAFYSIAISCLDMSVNTFGEVEVDEIVDYRKLDTVDLAKILFGREKLRQAMRTEIGAFLYEPSPDGCRNDGKGETCLRIKRNFLLSDVWLRLDVLPDVLDLDVIISLKKGLNGLCAVCKDALHSSAKAGRKSVWEKLPGYFGLEGWDRLKEITNVSGSGIPDEKVKKVKSCGWVEKAFEADNYP